MQDTPLRGKVIAERYQIVGLLEERGYSAVYQGQEIGSGALVLMKHTRHHTETARQRFNEELQRSIDNPHLARCVGWDSISGNDPRAGSWQIFEWKGGRTLATWLAEQNNQPDPQEAVRLMLQVCRAVKHLHDGQPGLIHKHIKPGSIGLVDNAEGKPSAFLREYGMTDLEQSWFMHSVAPFSANTRDAPELSSLFGTTDARTDVYAIGATLYELVTGQRPTSGQHRHLFRSQVDRADVVRPQVPRQLADVIERAMKLDAGERYASVGELSEALEEAIEPQRSDDWCWILIVGLLLIAIGALWVVSWNDAPAVAQVTTGSVSTPSGTDGGAAQPTAALVVLLPTLPPTATPDPVATLTAADAAFVSLSEPSTGLLPATADRPGDTQLSGSLTDFAVEAIFINPDSAAWDYGFAFRHDGNHHYRLNVASDGTWEVIYCTEEPGRPLCYSRSFLANGAVNGLAIGPGQENRLRLLVAGTYGAVFVNEQQVTLLNLVGPTDGGALFVAAGLRTNANPAAVTYRDLFVRGPQ